MKPKKVAFLHLLLLIFILLIVRTGFSQGKGTGTLSFEGVIERVSEDLKYIVINETKISISWNTQIIDENGNAIKADVLRQQFSVAVQVVQKRDGFLAKKIVIRKRKGV
jgi:hypothetical protein